MTERVPTCFICRDSAGPAPVFADVKLRRCEKSISTFLADHKVISTLVTDPSALVLCLPCNNIVFRCDEWLFAFVDGINKLRAKTGQSVADLVEISVELDPLVVVKTENVSLLEETPSY